MDLSCYSSRQSYPEIKVERKNTAYAMEMLSNMGGMNSEMSAVSLYFYNHLVTFKEKKISEIFRNISIVEMRHLDIFGSLALRLGADPRLWARQRNSMIYWTPKYNKYSFKLESLLRNSLEGELAAINKYKMQLKKICDNNIIENLERIIIDEQIHVDIFRKLLSEI